MAVATVGSQQFAGLVDGSGILVGSTVVVNADLTGVTLVFEDVLLDISPCAASIHAL